VVLCVWFVVCVCCWAVGVGGLLSVGCVFCVSVVFFLLVLGCLRGLLVLGWGVLFCLGGCRWCFWLFWILIVCGWCFVVWWVGGLGVVLLCGPVVGVFGGVLVAMVFGLFVVSLCWCCGVVGCVWFTFVVGLGLWFGFFGVFGGLFRWGVYLLDVLSFVGGVGCGTL